MSILEQSEPVPPFAEWGLRAFTTTRAVGSFGMLTGEPVGDVTRRWAALRAELKTGGPRLATAGQVHGNTVVEHGTTWTGWLRVESADGHLSLSRGTGMAVTVADCVPVFVAHPSGASALLHSGWRGTAARITQVAIARFVAAGLPAAELRLHLGPAICGRCYEVSAEVFAQLTGRDPGRPTCIDLRSLIADHARSAGVRAITTSPSCTRCDNDRFYSHRAGDAGRQLGVLIADA